MNRQRAAVVGALGIHYFKTGRFETAAEHRPEYLRVSQAERERAEREKKAETEVRNTVPEDCAAIAEMEHQLFPDAWSEKSVLETVNQVNTICLTAEKAGKTAGYVLAYTAADEAEIARIAVAQEMQRQGVARTLMNALEKECGKRNIDNILLDVREGNAAARAFYEAEGFRVDGIRQRFYDNPQEDGILMSRQTGKQSTTAEAVPSRNPEGE